MYHLMEQQRSGEWRILARFNSLESARGVLVKMQRTGNPLRFRIETVKEVARWDFEIEEEATDWTNCLVITLAMFLSAGTVISLSYLLLKYLL